MGYLKLLGAKKILVFYKQAQEGNQKVNYIYICIGKSL